MKYFQILLLVIFLGITGNAQDLSSQNLTCKERASQIVKNIKSVDYIRNVVEEGEIGDCIHFGWMDKMQDFGIWKAGYLVEYQWKKDIVKFKVLSVTYFTNVADYESSIIKSDKLLRKIKKNGLEKELNAYIISKAEKSIFAVRDRRFKDLVKIDSFSVYLYNDESLPLMYLID